MENIEYLSSRNKDLLLMGAKQTGSFLEGYYYIEESLYINESDELYSFCEYIENEIGGAGPINIDMLWLGFEKKVEKRLNRFETFSPESHIRHVFKAKER